MSSLRFSLSMRTRRVSHQTFGGKGRVWAGRLGGSQAGKEQGLLCQAAGPGCALVCKMGKYGCRVGSGLYRLRAKDSTDLLPVNGPPPVAISASVVTTAGKTGTGRQRGRPPSFPGGGGRAGCERGREWHRGCVSGTGVRGRRLWGPGRGWANLRTVSSEPVRRAALLVFWGPAAGRAAVAAPSPPQPRPGCLSPLGVQRGHWLFSSVPCHWPPGSSGGTC